MRDSLVANSVQSRNYNAEKPHSSQKQQKETKVGPSRDFTAGRCKRDPCRFSHSGSAHEHKRDESKHKNASHLKNKCTKCGSDQHTSKDCKFAGVCGWCKRVGHSDLVCHAKKANRPRALHADGNGDDGGEVYANMIRVPPIPARALYQRDPTPTMATKTRTLTKEQKNCVVLHCLLKFLHSLWRLLHQSVTWLTLLLALSVKGLWPTLAQTDLFTHMAARPLVSID